MKKIYKFLIAPILIIVIIFIFLCIKQFIINKQINNNFSHIFTEEKYQNPVSIENFDIIEQQISCGYACIELISKWQNTNITETKLSDENNKKITTAFESGFENEMNKQFLNFSTTKLYNLTNTELLDKSYQSLKNGVPVPFQFAALDNRNGENKWTLHFAVIIAMDIPKNKITISNPYGYIESYSIENFLEATRFNSYKNMETSFKLLFLFSIFHKNTIYIMESK